MKQFYLCAVIQNLQTARNKPKSKPLFGDLHLHPEQQIQRPYKQSPRWLTTRSFWIQMLPLQTTGLWQENRTLIGSRLHSSQIATCRVSGEVCFEWCDHERARFHEFTESERIRKIIWIIFSAINNINSALHLTQTCCIPPERTAAATHRHLDYFW